MEKYVTMISTSGQLFVKKNYKDCRVMLVGIKYRSPLLLLQVSSPPSGVWWRLPSIGLLAAKSWVPQQTPSKPLGATASQEHQTDAREEMELESHTTATRVGLSGP